MIKWVKNTSGSTKTWEGQELANNTYYQLQSPDEVKWANSSSVLTDIGSGDLTVAKDDSGNNDIDDVSEAINYLKNDLPKEVSIEGVTVESNRLQSMDNRVPNGYSLYVTGASDNITTGDYGTGNKLKFDSTNPTRNFQLLEHYYAIGARVTWESCTIDNYFTATLIAPASTSPINQTGDYNKIEVIPSSGLNIIIPTTPGTGSWDLDLTSKLTNTNVLKSTPVPAPGNTGYFDYDSPTNTLTVNTLGTGGYNLYDFDINLHSFGRYVWASSANGSIAELDVSGLVGKMLYNSWKIKLEFHKDMSSLGSEQAAVTFITATKKNI